MESSELMLGGRNESQYTGILVTAPVIQQGYWNITIDGVFVNGKSLGKATGGSGMDPLPLSYIFQKT